MKCREKGRSHKVLWGFIYVTTFLVVFAVSSVIKITCTPVLDSGKVDWNDSVGTRYTDLSYGEGDANKFDLYVPADKSRDTYGLVVYLHAGGFTGGDKKEDTKILQWLCSKGYVAAGINYTLKNETNGASVYSQSVEIRESIPYVISEAEKLGYHLDRMAISGGSAGGCLALIYAYRDADTSPLPVRMVFEGVGPADFHQEDWATYGLDQNDEACAAMFSAMSGTIISPEEIADGSYLQKVKPISAVDWVTKNTPPTVMTYGKHDTVQPFAASQTLAAALEKNGVDYRYFVAEHSGHGLQNDNKVYMAYLDAVEEYLDKYMRE